MNPKRHLPIALPAAGLIGITFLARANQAVVQTSAPLLGQQSLHLSPVLIGGVVAVYGAAAAGAARGIAARLAGRNLVVGAVAGLGVMAASTMIFAVAHSTALYVGAAVLGGASAGLCFPCLITIAGHSDTEDAERSVAKYTIALSASLFAGPLVDAAILASTHQSLRTAFWAFAPLPVVSAAVCVTLSSRSVSHRSLATMPAPSAPTADMHGEPDEFLTAPPHPVPGMSVRRSDPKVTARAFRLSILVLVLCEIPFGSVIFFGGLMARHEDRATNVQAALLFAGYFAVSFLVRIVFAARAPIRDKFRLARVCCLLMTGGSTFVIATHGLASLAAGMMILGCGDGITYTLGLSLIAAYTEPEGLVAANSTFSMVENSAIVIIPPVVGALSGWIDYRGAFEAMTAITVAVSVVVWRSCLEAPAPR